MTAVAWPGAQPPSSHDYPGPALPLTGSAPEVCGLPRGELTVALYASNAPLRTRRDLPARSALCAWAAQGLDRLGGELTWWYGYRSRVLRTDRPAENAEYTRIWPDQCRAALAWEATNRIARSGRGWPGDAARQLVTVVIPCVHAEAFITRSGATVAVPDSPDYAAEALITARDLEHARRYPARAAADCTLSHATGRPCAFCGTPR